MRDFRWNQITCKYICKPTWNGYYRVSPQNVWTLLTTNSSIFKTSFIIIESVFIHFGGTPYILVKMSM